MTQENVPLAGQPATHLVDHLLSLARSLNEQIQHDANERACARLEPIDVDDDTAELVADESLIDCASCDGTGIGMGGGDRICGACRGRGYRVYVDEEAREAAAEDARDAARDDAIAYGRAEYERRGAEDTLRAAPAVRDGAPS